jgi:hypothetical protein
MNQIRGHIKHCAIVTILYVGSYQVVAFLIDPLQIYFGTLTFASLAFLPHGIRVLSAIFYGAKNSFLYIFFASCVVLLLNGLPARTELTHVLQLLATASCVPIALVILRFGFGEEHISLKNVSPRTWRSFLVLVVFSSLLNGLMQHLAIHLGGTETNDFSLYLTFTIGDIIGAIITFVIAHSFLKIFHGLGRQ